MAETATPGNDTTFDLGRALQYVFDDPAWVKKVLLGGLFAFLSFVLIGALFVLGYWLRLIRRVAQGEARPLPEWEDYGGLLAEGAVAYGVYLVHMLLLIVPIGAGGCFIGLIAGVLGGSHGNHGTQEAAGLLAGIGMMGIYAIAFVVGIGLAIYMPAVLVRLAILRRFGVAFEVRENVAFIKRNTKDYVLMLVTMIVAHMIAQFGVLLCCVGVFPASFWAMCVIALPLGQLARRDAVLGPAVGRA
jgi:hypothetical protein